MDFKAVLFDMDGVLIDSEGYYAEGTFKWMQELGFQGVIEDIYPMIGTTMKVTYEILYDLLDGKVSLEEIERKNIDYFTSNPIPYNKILKEGVKETLIWLKENNIKTAVCSASPYYAIEEAMRECQIGEYIDYITSGEEFEKSKPNPEIYLSAAKKLNVDVHDCVVVEDSNLGIRAGKNAEMFVFALHDARFNMDQSMADVIVDSMVDVLEKMKSE